MHPILRGRDLAVDDRLGHRFGFGESHHIGAVGKRMHRVDRFGLGLHDLIELVLVSGHRLHRRRHGGVGEEPGDSCHRGPDTADDEHGLAVEAGHQPPAAPIAISWVPFISPP